jgi:hypothetical protein
VLEVFDQPEGIVTMPQRNVTTTPTQSLLTINGRWMLARAHGFAARLEREHHGDIGASITHAYQIAYGRNPTEVERKGIEKILFDPVAGTPANASDSAASGNLKLPAAFATEKMRFRDGTAALITPNTDQDRLVIPGGVKLPGNGFTAEAFITMKSVHATGTVAPIVSNWTGKKSESGWSLGVTGKGSRNTPQTLVLQLTGDKPWKPNDATEPIFSGLHVDLGKPYFVAVSVKLDDTSPAGVTFYCKDLSNDDEPMQVAQVAHAVTSGVASSAPIVIGGNAGARNVFDGSVDDVRITDLPLKAEQLLYGTPAIDEHTVGFWKFETADPYADSSGRGRTIAPIKTSAKDETPQMQALIDFCHVLLNSSEFLYVD